ncbi:MAG: AbrB/MazE/SpoVT family DNA-binding domain-containing protein [Acidobacteria bacterium]|nr:MAG: AbrB/MazE/SpoVT family DNA-binding domain-containing protein [Acidobacteriota bacterium]
MTTTIDAAGRIVIPKAIREEAEFGPGTEIEVEVDDGRVVLSPRVAHWHTEVRDGVTVMVPDRPVPPLTADIVNRTLARIRNERGRMPRRRPTGPRTGRPRSPA